MRNIYFVKFIYYRYKFIVNNKIYVTNTNILIDINLSVSNRTCVTSTSIFVMRYIYVVQLKINKILNKS